MTRVILPMPSEKQKLTKIMGLGVELTKANDTDVLLEYILYKARKLIKDDAGSIYMCL